jgi:hypothetical protein
MKLIKGSYLKKACRMQIVDRLMRNAINLPGWSTKRKIVIFESDDWGSIRMPSKENRDKLINAGFDFSNQPFNLYDALESNDDLTALFEVLKNHKDATGRHPVFTAVSIVANPVFEKIKAGNFQTYHYEPFTDTLKRYPNSENVLEYYKEGISERLFVPIFHGREHLNTQRWLRALKSGNKAVLKTFEQGVTAVHIGPNNEFLGDFQAAFDLDIPEDVNYMKVVLTEGLDLFEKLWGYKSPYFVATNGPFNNSLEQVLAEKGVKYILGERLQNEPLGNGNYKKHFHYIGLKNNLNQIYLTRNAMFEPSIFSNGNSIQPVEKCLKSIERAFRWGKPASISTHRLNYIGRIDENNRSNNLKLLDELLRAIIKKWPEVEFMTSIELGELITKSKK